MELCRFYRRNKITRKAVTRYKSATADRLAEYAVWQRETVAALQAVWQAGERILYCDECVFTKATIPHLDYAARYQNLMLDERQFYHKYYAVIAAVSADVGVDCVQVFDTAVTKASFITYLEELRRRNGTKPLHLYLDNLPAHRS